jgi:hypothetical protein
VLRFSLYRDPFKKNNSMAGRPRAQTQIVPPQDVLDNQAIHTEKWTLYGLGNAMTDSDSILKWLAAHLLIYQLLLLMVFYISQLIRYARASSNYSDFLKRHLHLRNRLLDQGYKKFALFDLLKSLYFATKILSKHIPSPQKRL